MFVTNWISTTKIQKISEITNFFRHYFLSRTEVTYPHFNSIKVRLERQEQTYCRQSCLFQFHKGTIRTHHAVQAEYGSIFQFHKGTIRTTIVSLKGNGKNISIP